MSNEQQLQKELEQIAAVKGMLKQIGLDEPSKEDQKIIYRIAKLAQYAYTAYYQQFGTTVFPPGAKPEPRVTAVNSVASLRDIFGGLYATDLQSGELGKMIRKNGGGS